jgi:hypothetical protein
MLDTIGDAVQTIWTLLPQITVGLRFGAALLAFGLTAGAALARLRRRDRAR